MADPALVPISDREAGSLTDAHLLFTKVQAVLRATHAEVRRTWHQSTFLKKLYRANEGGLLSWVLTH